MNTYFHNHISQYFHLSPIYYIYIGTSETKSKELLEKVFKTQSRFVRPVTDINKPVQTAFGIELIQIASVVSCYRLLFHQHICFLTGYH